jgi:hypothetical protein
VKVADVAKPRPYWRMCENHRRYHATFGRGKALCGVTVDIAGPVVALVPPNKNTACKKCQSILAKAEELKQR